MNSSHVRAPRIPEIAGAFAGMRANLLDWAVRDVYITP